MSLEKIAKETNAFICLDCGICTGSCPVSRVKPQFSPRLTVEKTLFDLETEVLEDKDLWSCLTCGLCSARCPSEVDYHQFIQRSRAQAAASGQRAVSSHGGVMEALMQLQTQGHPQNRVGWVDNQKLQVSTEQGEYFYFVGCLPYFEIIHSNIDVPSLSSARDAVRILNRLGIQPVVSNQERCCGHDLYWSGDTNSFKRLAELNLEAISRSGAKKVVFTCAEGYSVFKVEYPRYFGSLSFEVLHLTELLDEKISQGKLRLSGPEHQVTYQDPCRLGRALGIYEAPRRVLKAIEGLELLEMERHGSEALCCGSSQWLNCTSATKQLQVQRLREAQGTGAQTLVTACPKCRIHLSCTLRDMEKINCSEGRGFEIKDLVNLVAESMIEEKKSTIDET